MAGLNLDPVEMRRTAMEGLSPAWLDGRRELAEVNGRLEIVKAEQKRAKSALARVESSMEHVAGCRQLACLKCEEICTNSDDDDDA